MGSKCSSLASVYVMILYICRQPDISATYLRTDRIVYHVTNVTDERQMNSTGNHHFFMLMIILSGSSNDSGWYIDHLGEMPAISLSIRSLAATQMTNNGSIGDEELSNQVITTTESCTTCFFVYCSLSSLEALCYDTLYCMFYRPDESSVCVVDAMLFGDGIVHW